MRAARVLACAAVAAALRPVVRPSAKPSVKLAAAWRKAAAGALGLGLFGGAALAPPALALSADDYDAIYGMSATGGKGSSLSITLPSVSEPKEEKKDDGAAAKKQAEADAKAAKENVAMAAR